MGPAVRRPWIVLAASSLLVLAGCQDIAFLSTLEKIAAGQKWVEVTSSAPWAARRLFGAVEFAGKLWVLGGSTGNPTTTFFNDVWSSPDGVTWTRATAAAPWAARDQLGVVAYGGKMWVAGGANGPPMQDVWWSTDGTNWTQATATAAWGTRFGHANLVFNGEMWVIGGAQNGSSFLTDAWHSNDGVTWNQASPSVPVSGGHPAAVVFGSRIWAMGGVLSGSYFNEVAYSGVDDGTTWSSAPNATWAARTTQAVIYGGGILIVAGTSASTYSDEWFTTDGMTWTQSDAAGPWGKRRGHAVIAFNNRLYLIGGFDGSSTFYNDVWSFGQ